MPPAPPAPSAELVVQKPTGPAGLPLPRTDNSVTWAITDENKPIKDGLKPEPGPLRIYNYADYLDPATLKRFQKQFSTKVEVATYNSSDEAVAKLSSGAVDFDLIMGLSGSNIVDLIAHKLLLPLNHAYLPNLEKNVWPPLVDPFYDRGSHYTIPYVVWMDGIGWRNDKVKEDIAGMDVPWDIFWHAQAYRGKVGILDDRRDALSMPMQRDAMQQGDAARPQHRGRGRRQQGPERPLRAQRHLQPEGDDHRLPDAARGQDGAAPVVVGGPALGGVLLPARRASRPTCCRSGGRRRTASSRTTSSPSGRHRQASRCSRTSSSTSCSTRRTPTTTSSTSPATRRRRTGIDAETLLKQGLIPKTLEEAVVRPDQFAANQELLQLSVTGQRFWDDAWSKFKAG